jgi:hypothetical protein
VPRLCRGGDHPSSPDIAIGVKRPTQGSRPSTLNSSRSPQTSGQLRPLIRSCSGRGLSSQPVSRLPVSSCLAISPLPAPRCHRGRWRCVSVALSVGSPLLGVTQRPARWSSDFPPLLDRGGHPACSPKSILRLTAAEVKSWDRSRFLIGDCGSGRSARERRQFGR